MMLTRTEMIVLGALLIAVVAVPLFGSTYIISAFFFFLIAFILAQSWDWIGGDLGYVNLGHFLFYGIGAYAFSLTVVGSGSVALALIMALAITGIAGLLLAFPLFRLNGDYFAFASLALLPLAEITAMNMSWLTGGADGVVLPPRDVLLPAYFLAILGGVAAFALTLYLSASKFGYAMKAVRNDDQVAETLGVRIFPVKMIVLAVSAVFAGYAGAVQSWQLSYIDPHSVFAVGLALAPIAKTLFGGSRLLWGPLVGVLAITALQQWLLVTISTGQVLIFGAIILLIGRYMPGGILRARVLRRIGILRDFTLEHDGRLLDAMALPGPLEIEPGLPLEKRAPDRSRPLLECVGVTKAFGGNLAVNDLSLTLYEGEIVGLVGANGSGKTTLFNCISRVLDPTSGSIRIAGVSVGSLRRDQATHSGVGRTYQIPRPFGDLTVLENIAISLMYRENPLAPKDAILQAMRFAVFVGLGEFVRARASSLSLQQKKGLEMARALATGPRLLLVDEMASGLTTAEISQFVEMIRKIRDDYGITVIWVEHVFSALARVVDRVVVMDSGSVISDGPLSSVMKDERVLRAYLGHPAEQAV